MNWLKQISSFVSLTLVIFFIYSQTIGSSTGKIIIVDDENGSWRQFEHITEAIENSSNNDVIRIYNGTYMESININKSLNIIGNSSKNTIIDGEIKTNPLNINSNHSIIRNIHFLNQFSKDSSDGAISVTDSDNITIENCTFMGSTTSSISINNSYNITINDCFFDEESLGGYGVIYLENSSRFKIEGNIIRSQGEIAIKMVEVDDSTISNNSVINCDEGFFLVNSSSNSIKRNSFVNIFYNCVFIIGNSFNNRIYYNDFSGHLSTRHDNDWSSHNYWNNSLVGNYWNGDSTIDSDGNGILDNPWRTGKFTKIFDYLPLTHPPYYGKAPNITINTWEVIPESQLVGNKLDIFIILKSNVNIYHNRISIYINNEFVLSDSINISIGNNRLQYTTIMESYFQNISCVFSLPVNMTLSKSVIVIAKASKESSTAIPDNSILIISLIVALIQSFSPKYYNNNKAPPSTDANHRQR